jgi:hypothetical protein
MPGPIRGASFFEGLPFDLEEDEDDLALDGEASFFELELELELEAFFELELDDSFELVDAFTFDFFLDADESLLRSETYMPPPPDSSSISMSLLSFGMGRSGGVGRILRGDSI